MIKLEVDDYCHGCRFFDPKLDTMYYGNKPLHIVTCSERDKCHNIETYLEQKMKENNHD